MSPLLGKTHYDRRRIMARAAQAREKRKYKKAITLYRQVLEHEPKSTELHRKLAPLLAQTKQESEAKASYSVVLSALMRDGFSEQVGGLYREALSYMPLHVELWAELAELQVKRQLRADAVQTLLEGRRRFRSRKYRSQAIRLLLLVQEVEPYHLEGTLDLAGLLSRSGGVRQALGLLDGLAGRTRGRSLRRVRGRQLRLRPGFGTAGRWMRALALGR